jgi:hypothetical protein
MRIEIEIEIEIEREGKYRDFGLSNELIGLIELIGFGFGE